MIFYTGNTESKVMVVQSFSPEPPFHFKLTKMYISSSLLEFVLDEIVCGDQGSVIVTRKNDFIRTINKIQRGIFPLG